MKIALNSDKISVQIDTKGAELQMAVNHENGLNYMWNGDANFWGKFSPVLFPIVGALKNDEYFYQDKTYKLTRHGFARDYEFEIEKHTDSEVLLSFSDDEQTLKSYPFKFKLSIHYKVVDSKLTCTYIVENPVNKPMFFSIGAHPAFAVPLTNGLAYTDYFLQFNNDEVLDNYPIAQNLVGLVSEKIDLEENNVLPLTHQLFYNDALVFKSLKSDSVNLLCTKNNNGLKFDFAGFPFFGIWAAIDANFVCLEPWCGIADSMNHNGQLLEKEGIIHLEGNATWQKAWSVSLF